MAEDLETFVVRPGRLRLALVSVGLVFCALLMVAWAAAACIAANHVVALLGQVERVAASVGLDLESFLPLTRAAVDDVDALGALRVSLALLPHLRRGTVKKLVHVTSGLGSIGDNRSGGSYAYRMAKAALNMMSKNLAIELRAEGITSIVISPGWVQTDMGGPHAPVTPQESVRGMLRVIESATLAESGEFLDWKGGRYPY